MSDDSSFHPPDTDRRRRSTTTTAVVATSERGDGRGLVKESRLVIDHPRSTIDALSSHRDGMSRARRVRPRRRHSLRFQRVVFALTFASSLANVNAMSSSTTTTRLKMNGAPRATMDARAFVGPRALVFGDVDFARHRAMATTERRNGAPGVEYESDACARVSLSVREERHEVRLCAGAEFASRAKGKSASDGNDEQNDDEDVVTKHFHFGLESSPIGEEAVVRVDAEANAMVAPIGDERATNSLSFTTTRRVTSDGTYVRLPVVVRRRKRGCVSRELAWTIACAVALAGANAALAMWNRRMARTRAREDARANAPDSARLSWDDIVGEENVERMKILLEEREERRRIPVPTSEFVVHAKAEALEFGTRDKTGNLLYDFLTAYPHSIAPTYLQADWDSDDEALQRQFRQRGDVDVFGNKFIPGKPFRLRIFGHGDLAGKSVLSDILAHESFSDARLKIYSDDNEE